MKAKNVSFGTLGATKAKNSITSFNPEADVHHQSNISIFMMSCFTPPLFIPARMQVFLSSFLGMV